MQEIKQTTWKDWVDWAPTYWILGASLVYFIKESGVIQPVLDKFWKKDQETE